MVESNPSTLATPERESAPVAAPPPAPTPPPVPPSTSRKEWLRPLAIIAVAMIVLTVLSSAAVLWMGDRTVQASYPAGTPEAAMQAYIAAYEKGDYDTASSYLSSRLKSEGITTKVAGSYGPSAAGLGVTITSARVNGDRATLVVQITRSSNSVLGNTSSSYETSVALVREGGSWKIDSEDVVFL